MILKEVSLFYFRAFFLTTGARDGALKNIVQTQREKGMQINCTVAKSGALQRHYCITAINNARSARPGIAKSVEF